jgi:ubiquinone/menaquinone biosynthesis C-methylase UbiE
MTPDESWLRSSYDEFPRIEEAFHGALRQSLQPRGPDRLYDIVQSLDLPAASVVADVGCGEGHHALRLAERFHFTVVGIDPVPRHLELANAQAASAAVRFVRGSAESLPLDDASVDLVWCRDVLGHVEALEQAYAEFERVLRRGGSAIVYQAFGTERLEPREAEWFWRTMGVVPSSADIATTYAAIEASGLQIEQAVDLADWGEWAEEHSQKSSERLLFAARLLREPERYVAQFGRPAYEIMLGDCHWHVYGMIGKLARRAFVLSRP